MLSGTEFIRQSLELHLFFARIMKEHALFLGTAFTPRDANYIQLADALRIGFDGLLAEAVSLSNGNVSPDVLQSGEVISQYTLNAEMATAFFTGANIQTGLTQAEAGLQGSTAAIYNPVLEQRVNVLNQKAINFINAIIQFKASVLANVLSCKMFTNNYPLLVDHILREARFYLRMLQRVQNREEIDIQREAYEQEIFWNRIMAEHSKFIRGLLDPTENELIATANNFGNQFDRLTNEAKAAMDKTLPLTKVTNDSLKATAELRNFKANGTQGILECKVRSIILPLLADHTLREANHYLRLLKIFKR